MRCRVEHEKSNYISKKRRIIIIIIIVCKRHYEILSNFPKVLENSPNTARTFRLFSKRCPKISDKGLDQSGGLHKRITIVLKPWVISFFSDLMSFSIQLTTFFYGLESKKKMVEKKGDLRISRSITFYCLSPYL